VTSALPEAVVVGVSELTEGAGGRFDSAVARLDDDRLVVVRIPADDTAEKELRGQAAALRALTPGVLGQLRMSAPRLIGDTIVDGRFTVVTDFVEGYRVDAAEVPPGRGVATAIGRALAAVHALPVSVVSGAGLANETPEQVRQSVSRLLDRVAALHRIPVSLLSRWSHAAAADHLWRFESTVILGGASSDAFLLADVDGEPQISGILDWHGLAVGDPALDLQWLSSAPRAALDVFDAYTQAGVRAPDAGIHSRARLYAELEFAKWLVHGDDIGSDDIIADAVSLLTALADSVHDDDLTRVQSIEIDDALDRAGRVPEIRIAVDTSMQTDAYDPDELGVFEESEPDQDHGRAPQTDAFDETGAIALEGQDDGATVPVDMGEWIRQDATDADPEGRAVDGR
jgi:aminoglycoside phosphotransferase (APT) family kinase protein